MATVTVRYEDDDNDPIATVTAVHIVAADFDYVDETDNSETRYFISAEMSGTEAARSVEFSGPGPFTWDGWVAPVAGVINFFLRRVSDSVQVASVTKTFA